MLQNLHVKNLALIDEIEIDFANGLNILTGETGAGKSIILGSIGLALGGRFSSDFLRKGAAYGLVELTFSIENEGTRQKLLALDVLPEDGQVIISRKLTDGKSVNRINGETVTLSRVKEVAAVLIDLHGQHEHQSLLYKKNHLAILDLYAKEGQAVRDHVAMAYKEYQKVQKELREADTDAADRAKELDFLKFEIQEIEDANLTPEEDEQLEEQYRMMSNGKRMADNLEEAYACISGSEAASELISRAVRSLYEIQSLDPRARELYDQLMELESLTGDLAHDLSGYLNDCQFSPEEFYEAETRLNEINHLKSKYGRTVEDVLSYLEDKKKRLAILEDYDFYLDNLRKALKKAEKAYLKECEVLHDLRVKAASSLGNAVQNGLLELNFLDVNFQIHFDTTSTYTSLGTDDVEFMISMNPGLPVRPLAEVASGGELSRIMLALKACLADQDEIETLIFDEIDTGISGRTAQKVSEKMGQIAAHHQVLCITHLAQIAAMADVHYVIEKTVFDQMTTTSIHRLDKEEEIDELARILGGVEITEKVLENAREMKIFALKFKGK